jgi:hypothetical protein
MPAGTPESRQFRDLFPVVIPFRQAVTLTAAAGAETSAAITVAGAALGDIVLFGIVGDLADATVSANVNAANTVEITLANATASTVTLASVQAYGVVLKPGASITNA